MVIDYNLSYLVMTVTMCFCYFCFVFLNTLANLQSQLFQVMLKLLHTSNILVTECVADLKIFSRKSCDILLHFYFLSMPTPKPDTNWFSISMY